MQSDSTYSDKTYKKQKKAPKNAAFHIKTSKIILSLEK